MNSATYVTKNISKESNGYDYYLFTYWRNGCDPRTVDYSLMSCGPWTMIAIVCAYLIVVTRIGPNFMKNRKAYELRSVMLTYNVFMVLINTFFMWQSLLWINFGQRLLNFDFPSLTDRSPLTMKTITMFYWYMITKLIDLMDTFFFVFRKKTNQITVLHLYHHISVPIIGWISVWVSESLMEDM